MNPNGLSTTNTVQLPEPTLRRLPWYLAFLTMLRVGNVEYVSTTRIAEELDVDPSQIAKDLSFLGLKGKTRIGYRVDELEAKLRDFLGFGRRHNAVMVGAGSLGSALIADSGLQRYGLNIVAGIDTNPDRWGTTVNGVQIYAPDALAQLVNDMNIGIGIIAVPFEFAQEVSDTLCRCGVRAIWNFTACRIRVPEGIVISNTSIYSNLALIYNRLSSVLPEPR